LHVKANMSLGKKKKKRKARKLFPWTFIEDFLTGPD
jgi:hypothetical protein